MPILGFEENTAYHTTTHQPVRWTLAPFLLCFIGIGLLVRKKSAATLGAIQDIFLSHSDWGFVLSAILLWFYGLSLAFSRFGNNRPSDPDEKPECSPAPWFAMLKAFPSLAIRSLMGIPLGICAFGRSPGSDCLVIHRITAMGALAKPVG